MTTSGNGRIFISYRRADSAGYAGRIYDRLTAHFGVDAVFMDVDTIEAGVDFVQVLQNAVQSCDVLVALIGRRWLNIKDEAGQRRLDNPEDFVGIEVAAALSRDIRVIPVLVDGAPIPRSSELPDNLKPLARRNALQVDHDSFNADARRLIAQLELALEAAEDSRVLKARRLQEEQERQEKKAHEAEERREAARRKQEKRTAEDKNQIEKEALENARRERIVREKKEAEEKARKATLRKSRQQEAVVRIKNIFSGGNKRFFYIGGGIVILFLLGYVIKSSLTSPTPTSPTNFTATPDRLSANSTESRTNIQPSPSPASEQPTTVSQATPKINCLDMSKINVRQYPSGNDDGVILGNLECDTPVTLTGKYLGTDDREWFQISYTAANNQTILAWVIASRVDVEPEIRDSLTVLDYFGATVSPTPLYTPTSVLGVGSTMISEKDDMVMVYIPAGEFQMGSDADEALAECQKFRTDCQRDWFTNEEPIHTIYLDSFWIDQTEVTNAMYAKCVASNECDPHQYTDSVTRDAYYGNLEFDDYPVIYVSWDDAAAYCKWAGRRLLTEAEWEKAAGWDEEAKAQRLYPWGNTFDGTKVNFCDANCTYDSENHRFGDDTRETTPVGSYPAGASFYGVYDMAGNVWEWTADWYDVYPGGDKNASQRFGQTYRVRRGGAWSNYESDSRVSNRMWGDPSSSSYYAVGFRCSRSP